MLKLIKICKANKMNYFLTFQTNRFHIGRSCMTSCTKSVTFFYITLFVLSSWKFVLSMMKSFKDMAWREASGWWYFLVVLLIQTAIWMWKNINLIHAICNYNKSPINQSYIVYIFALFSSSSIISCKNIPWLIWCKN